MTILCRRVHAVRTEVECISGFVVWYVCVLRYNTIEMSLCGTNRGVICSFRFLVEYITRCAFVYSWALLGNAGGNFFVPPDRLPHLFDDELSELRVVIVWVWEAQKHDRKWNSRRPIQHHIARWRQSTKFLSCFMFVRCESVWLSFRFLCRGSFSHIIWHNVSCKL